MSINSETSKRLREARNAKGWSQSELARLSKGRGGRGLTPGAIGNYEQGIRVPNHDSAGILESIFGLPSAYWMGVISKEEALVINAMRRGAQDS